MQILHYYCTGEYTTGMQTHFSYLATYAHTQYEHNTSLHKCHTLSHPVSVILVLTMFKAVHTEAACWVSLAVPVIFFTIQIEVVVFN